MQAGQGGYTGREGPGHAGQLQRLQPGKAWRGRQPSPRTLAGSTTQAPWATAAVTPMDRPKQWNRGTCTSGGLGSEKALRGQEGAWRPGVLPWCQLASGEHGHGQAETVERGDVLRGKSMLRPLTGRHTLSTSV